MGKVNPLDFEVIAPTVGRMPRGKDPPSEVPIEEEILLRLLEVVIGAGDPKSETSANSNADPLLGIFPPLMLSKSTR
jgi:hypothetical protein